MTQVSYIVLGNISRVDSKVMPCLIELVNYKFQLEIENFTFANIGAYVEESMIQLPQYCKHIRGQLYVQYPYICL